MYFFWGGAHTFIPGFEEQLIGVKKGEHRQINIEFPADYPQEEAAGKAALFEVSVKEVRERTETAIDDEMAKRQGLDDLVALTDLVRGQLQKQFDEASQAKLKRTLLDDLAERYEFEVPAGMVDQEFEAMLLEAPRVRPGVLGSLDLWDLAWKQVKLVGEARNMPG